MLDRAVVPINPSCSIPLPLPRSPGELVDGRSRKNVSFAELSFGGLRSE